MLRNCHQRSTTLCVENLRLNGININGLFHASVVKMQELMQLVGPLYPPTLQYWPSDLLTPQKTDTPPFFLPCQNSGNASEGP